MRNPPTPGQWTLGFPPPCGDHSFARGLYLHVHAKGASWVFRYPAKGGKRREMGIGAFLATNEAQAVRALASALERWEALRAMVDSGRDPLKEKAERAEASRVVEMRRKSGTLLQAARQYHEACIEPQCEWKYARQWLHEFENDIPGWLLHKVAADVTSDDVIRALSEIPSTLGRRVDKARQRIDQVFEWLIRHGRAPANAAGVRRNVRPRWQKRLDLAAPTGDFAPTTAAKKPPEAAAS